MSNIRVRFAPSPTGALHIGGVRTALFNYLFAKQNGGKFLLRIEDTDQKRYVAGAEKYIEEALLWCGLKPDEGAGYGGDYGPYRQSERKDLYKKHVQQLIDSGMAYYAFDTAEELDAKREEAKAAGNHSFKYDSKTRASMRNSESLDAEMVEKLLANNTPYTIRLKIPSGETVCVQDLIRGDVQFQSDELDDKVLFKADGLPTYHLANIVDDHAMEITHVIRGEEWLPSLPLHFLLYKAFGWTPPKFAHLPLILKPTGKGKLSKRDGAKLGIPVFPLAWKGETEEDSFDGFREFGFDPKAVINFLAFLGWNPGTEQEIFTMQELVDAFSIENISKGGARFDFDKAKWYNQQYIINSDNADLLTILKPMLQEKGIEKEDAFLSSFVGLMKERVHFYGEFLESGYYFFEDVKEYDAKTVRKKWKPEKLPLFQELRERLNKLAIYEAATIETEVKAFMADHELGFGAVLPILRVAVTGTMRGPAIFEVMALLGKADVNHRLEQAYAAFELMKGNV